jgi:hypothetical protein
MKTLHLVRDRWTHTETEGVLTFGDATFYTIERPWIATDPGGKPFESCIPAGRYMLRPHVHHGDDVVALVNEGHAVYYMNEDRPNEVGRYKVLLHTGNWSADVVGCIAPGKLRSASGKGPMVTSSRDTMKKVMEYIDGDAAVLNISWQAEEPA